MSTLGLWNDTQQSNHEAVISDYTLSLIAAGDHDCNKNEVTVIGYFDVTEDMADRKIGNTIYVQAFEIEYKVPEKLRESMLGKFAIPEYARALYGITDEGRVDLWAN